MFYICMQGTRLTVGWISFQRVVTNIRERNWSLSPNATKCVGDQFKSYSNQVPMLKTLHVYPHAFAKVIEEVRHTLVLSGSGKKVETCHQLDGAPNIYVHFYFQFLTQFSVLL